MEANRNYGYLYRSWKQIQNATVTAKRLVRATDQRKGNAEKFVKSKQPSFRRAGSHVPRHVEVYPI